MPVGIALERPAVNVADRPALDQFHGVGRRETRRTVGIFAQFVVQFYHPVPVMREVHDRLPRQTAAVNRIGAQRHLDALVLDVAGIFVPESIGFARQGRQLEELVVGVGLVVSGVDSQPVAEETPFETRFERIGHFGLEVGARSRIGGVDAPLPAVMWAFGLVMNIGMSLPTRLHVRRTLANDIHSGSLNILPTTHDAPNEQ